MFKIMSKLINKKFYDTAEEAQQKCDVFYAVGRLTDDEYTDLWKVFFETIAIKERTNSKCQNNLFPMWTRTHAVEFN